MIGVRCLKILVIFGSGSDEPVYNPILEELKKADVHYEMRICSAHRTPDELNEILLHTDADVIISGAGLAAHLPGVVASKVIKPIIGVPVERPVRSDASLLIVPVISVPSYVGGSNSGSISNFSKTSSDQVRTFISNNAVPAPPARSIA